ncbi:extracellular calcium-sensing receptor-like protein [Labeo rohita]|uniref:Gypsy retrotransposon integrase-like protein 1 n=1 Tax=Labeo rohita TaxID=84645 RepID=A0A498NN97_LABRO|nr:extracellular calcium-sensing receptor-like protein [Labeo rohita]
MALMNGYEETLVDTSCSRPPAVNAIVGESNSSPTIALASIAGPFSLPVISHFATCACLSNRKRYASFFRTIPSDYYQSRALAQLVKYFGWTWVGTVRSRSDYGNNGIAAFEEAAKQEGICIEYSETILRTDPQEQFLKTLEVIKKGTARVVLAFVALRDFFPLVNIIAQHNITGIQWVGSESWITSRTIAETKEYRFLSGALGFAIANAKLVGLREFLVNVHPDQEPKNELLKEFWETAFQCSFRISGNGGCTGSENLAELQNEYTDVSELRIANKVYTAVYAIAHTLHNVLKDLKSSTNSSKVERPAPQKVLEYMRDVRFTVKTGEDIFFDASGDPVARYDLVNWQPVENGGLQFKHVGVYDSSLPSEHRLQVNQQHVLWAGNSGQLPVSVCSKSCPPGTRKAVQKGRPVCCYDCIPCAEGEISNGTVTKPNILHFFELLRVITTRAEHWQNWLDTLAGPGTYPEDKVIRIIEQIKSSTSRVIVGFLVHWDLEVLLHKFVEYNITGYQWISHFATCACLSNRKEYPSFFRTIPSDYYQSRALAQLVRHFGWMWVGALSNKNDYGIDGITTFIKAANEEGVCIEYSEAFESTSPYHEIVRIVNIIRTSTSKVLNSLQSINFTTPVGENVFFDNNGDSPARYELINLQSANKGKVEVETIGYYDASLPKVRAVPQALEKLCRKENLSAVMIVYYAHRERSVTPQISHFATCACLSDRKKHPSFFRTIPSDYYQSQALAKLVKYFGWTWVGALCSDNDYGNNGMNTFIKAATKFGVCVEFSEAFFRTDPREEILRIVDIVKKSSSKVIVAFVSYSDMEILLGEIAQQNITGLQWIGSESWISDMNIATGKWQQILRGSMGFAIPKAEIRGLKDFLTKLNPSSDIELHKELWETIFQCKLPPQETSGSQIMCKGNESFNNVQNQYTDVTELQIANNVYKAVYAVAYALNSTLSCSKWDSNQSKCLEKVNNTWQVLNALREVSFFTETGEKVFFDKNGDPAASESCPTGTRKAVQKGKPVCCYDCIPCAEGEISNKTDFTLSADCEFHHEWWRVTAKVIAKVTKGTIEVATIGYYDATQPHGKEFTMNNVNIIWGGGQMTVDFPQCVWQVPVSVGSESCPLGTRKAVQKGRPICCFYCIPCPPGEISNTTEQHLKRLEVILSRLKQEGLKARLEKYFFFQKEVRYLGHVISTEGVSTDPILAYADFSRPFILEVDASHARLGVVLSQEQGGRVQPIAYASHSLRANERNMSNYSSMKLEFLALKWAMTKKFREYLLEQKCVVFTDNNPLSHLNSAKLGATEQRWAAQLASFDFELKCRSGRNRNADALSRLNPTGHRESSFGTKVPVEVQEGVEDQQVILDTHVVTQTAVMAFPSHSIDEIRSLQRADLVFSEVLGLWERKTIPGREERCSLSKSALALLWQWDRLVERDGVVYRRILRLDGGEELLQVLLPCALQREVLNLLNQEYVHQGIEHSTELVRHRCYWPGMAQEIASWCQECERCQVAKDSQPPARSFIGHLLASRPNEVDGYLY